MQSLGTLVPEEPCILCTTRCQIYCGLTHNGVFCWYFHLILHAQIAYNTDKGQETNSPIQIYVKITSYVLTAAICISLNKYVIADVKNLLQKFPQSLLFKNYLFVEVAYLLVRFNTTKFFVCNTHMHTKPSEEDNTGKRSGGQTQINFAIFSVIYAWKQYLQHLNLHKIAT